MEGQQCEYAYMMYGIMYNFLTTVQSPREGITQIYDHFISLCVGLIFLIYYVAMNKRINLGTKITATFVFFWFKVKPDLIFYIFVFFSIIIGSRHRIIYQTSYYKARAVNNKGQRLTQIQKQEVSFV